MPVSNRITLEPGKRGGRPCIIRHLRISVYDVLAMLSNGMNESEILEDFPELESADIKACLAYAAAAEEGVVLKGDNTLPLSHFLLRPITQPRGL